MRRISIYIFLLGLVACNGPEGQQNENSSNANDNDTEDMVNSSGIRFYSNESDNSTQICIESPLKKGECIFKCYCQKEELNVKWTNHNSIEISYPFESFVDQKKTSTVFFNPAIKVSYTPYSKDGSIDSVYSDFWCKTEYLNFSDYSKAVNITKFTLQMLSTVSESCMNDSIFRKSFIGCIQNLLKENPTLLFYVIVQNEQLKKDLIYELINSIDKDEELIRKIVAIDLEYMPEEKIIRDEILELLK